MKDAATILGVTIANLTFADGVSLVLAILGDADAPFPHRPAVLQFANAHTLNCACTIPDFRSVLGRADLVFGDGTGVRWAARLNNIRLKANLNGTDLIPALFQAGASRGYRYYLLGSEPDTIARAAEICVRRFPSWSLCGYHHGYLTSMTSSAVLDEINRRQPHLLLVGMGNPLQEQWIDAHRDQLHARLCVGVGGLFDYLAGRRIRAPRPLRVAGLEWLFVSLSQPHKFMRYAIGNPLFLWRVVRKRFAPSAAPGSP